MGIAEVVLATGLGWTAAVVNMVDPGAGIVAMYSSQAAKEKAEKRKAAGDDWIVVYYEGNVMPNSVRSFSTVVAWRLFYVWVAREIIDNYPNPETVVSVARWYPARKAVVFTGEWEDVPLMPAAIKPTEELVFEWIKFQRKEAGKK